MAFHLAPPLPTFLVDLDSKHHSNTEEAVVDDADVDVADVDVDVAVDDDDDDEDVDVEAKNLGL